MFSMQTKIIQIRLAMFLKGINMLSKGTKREVVNMKTLLEKEEQIKIKDLRP